MMQPACRVVRSNQHFLSQKSLFKNFFNKHELFYNSFYKLKFPSAPSFPSAILNYTSQTVNISRCFELFVENFVLGTESVFNVLLFCRHLTIQSEFVRVNHFEIRQIFQAMHALEHHSYEMCYECTAHQYDVYVVVQFHPWLKCHFPLFLGMVVCDNKFKTKGNKI